MASTAEAHQSERATIAIEGMSCSSCAARIEKRLNRIDGVSASVNYAAEQAAVSFDPAHASVDDLIGAVEAAGYHASPAGTADGAHDSARSWLLRLSLAAVLSVPLVLLPWVSHPASPRVAMGIARAGHPGGVLLAAGRFTPRGRDERPGTWPPRWTHSSPSARWPPGPGRSSCSLPACTRSSTSMRQR